MCPMNCHPTLCGMKATVENGELKSIEGDVDNPDSRGFLCMRGRASKEIIGNAERLLYPMVREQRGTDGWRRASWDEVIERIGTKLESIEPKAFGIWMGHGDSATNNGTRSGSQLAKRFAHLYGSQWWHPAMICWGLGGFGLGITGVLEVNTKEDMSAHADLIILWGANIASQPNTGRHIKAAKKRGARIITIDIRDSEATARADQHYRLAPGSDAALALAIMHVLVKEQLTNDEFIAQHTLGFDALREHVEQFSPAWAAQHTGLAAEDIVRLAHEYAGTPRAVIVMGGSSMHRGANGWNSARAIACLPALTGKLGMPGTGLGERHGAATHGHGLGTLVPETPSACKDIIPDQMASMLDAFDAGKIKALLLNGTNLLSSFADVNRAERGLDKVELIVCIDLFMNETLRRQADIILPATAWLEQLGAKMTHTHLYLMEQALAPAGQCKTFAQFLRALASRLRVDDFFPWADDAAMYDTLFDHPSTDHISITELRAMGGIKALSVSQHAYPTHAYATPSGQVEFYSERAKSLGLPPLPSFEPEPTPASYPLRFRQGRTLNHFHSFYDHGQALPTMRKHGGQPTIWISVADAAKRAVENGAPVRIFNQRGECAAAAMVTDKVPAGTVWMRDGWPDLNRLTNGDACLPDAATSIFAFGVGQSLFDADVDIEKLPKTS